MMKSRLPARSTAVSPGRRAYLVLVLLGLAGASAAVTALLPAAASAQACNPKRMHCPPAPPPGSPPPAPAAPADVGVVKTVSAQSVAVGAQVTYTMTVANHGPGAASDVMLTDPLPSGLTYVSVSATRGSCTGGTTVSCSIDSLLNGESAVVTLVVTVSAPGTISNTAAVGADEADPNVGDNNRSTAVVTAAAPAAIAPPPPAAPPPTSPFRPAPVLPVIGDASEPQLPPLLPPPSGAVGIDVSGNGTVVGGGGRQLASFSAAGRAASVSCGVRGFVCYAEVRKGDAITLKAIPADGFVFKQWSGACAGSRPTCAVVLGGLRAVSATFVPRSGAAVGAALAEPQLRVSWLRSIGRGLLVVRGQVTRPANIEVAMRRPHGGPLVTERQTVGAGVFTQSPKLLPSLLPRGARMLPGGFVVSLTGSTSGARLPLQLRTVVLPSPPEGVVRRAYASRTSGGAPSSTLGGGSTEAWANFVFAVQPAAGRAISVRWYRPDGRLLGVAKKSNRPVITSFIRSRPALPKGAWRADLVVGQTVVQRLSIRVR
jgi:uncharacterized repeat protein (TIGR01451 family)